MTEAGSGAERRVVVMKFGGTSVAELEGRKAIAKRVTAALAEHMAPVVVVSAMGRRGAPYATDTLLSLVDGMPTDQRERDLIAASGETIAAVVVAHELRAAGVPARAFTGPEAGIVTDGAYGAATVTAVCAGPLSDVIADGVVPVVAGFQGAAPDGTLTTLGRGGSDTTACALGVALAAEAVEIHTDVDGVMTADPCVYDGADVLEVIRADELFQMAWHGARVIHTPAAELALSSGLELRVRNTLGDHPGTRVADIAAYRPDAVATAVSSTEGVVRVRVALPGPEGSIEHMTAQTRVYRAMADAGVSLDMFTPAEDGLFFTVPETALTTVSSTLASLGLAHAEQRGLAKVTLVGAGMHGVPGVMARVAKCLVDAGVAVLQSADSHTTISVLIEGERTRAAVNALHTEFGLGRR